MWIQTGSSADRPLDRAGFPIHTTTCKPVCLPTHCLIWLDFVVDMSLSRIEGAPV